MRTTLKAITHRANLRLRTWIVIVILLIGHTGLAQQQDNPFQKKLNRSTPSSIFIAPAILIGSGIFMLTKNGLVVQEEIRDFRNKHFASFSYTADDYLQYAPLAILLGMKTLGVSSEHNWPQTIDLIIKAEALVVFFSVGLKHATQITRPDSNSPNSFPSGHTMQAFAAATLLHKEFGKNRPWVSISAYALASTVGIMRILRNRHWASDVLVGAGMGILLTQLIYLIDKKERDRKNSIKVSVQRFQNGVNSLGLAIPIR